MPKPYQYLLFTLPILIIVVVLCVLFVDRPVAEWTLGTFQYPGSKSTLHLAVLATQLVYAVMLILFLLYFILRVHQVKGYFMECFWLLNTSIVFAFFIKMTLEFLFGRIVPRYAGSSVLLFMRNPKLYGFHWLQSGSFPSGHMTILTAGLTAIVLYYPRLFWPSVLLVLLLACTLLALNYHFVSDVIAGTYLGLSVALALHWLMRQHLIPLC